MDDQAAAEISELLQRELSGRFDVLRVLGRGGMGTVFLARELSLDRLVAIKVRVRNTGESPAVLDRFRREARLAASLEHPAIIRVYAVGDSTDLVWFAMEYVEGPSLEQYVRDAGMLAPARAIQLLRELSGALAYAHAQGIVHRDVKPANVLMAMDGRFLLADFGIAKQESEEALTTTGRIIGTPSYMSPEQFRGQPLTAASDQYALGGVVYFACTGREPFAASDIAVLIRSHLLDPPPSVAAVNRQMPAAFDQVVRRMLAKTPEERFPTLHDILPALQSMPLAPETSAAPASPGVARRRIVLVLVAVGCTGGAVWWNTRPTLTVESPSSAEATADSVDLTLSASSARKDGGQRTPMPAMRTMERGTPSNAGASAQATSAATAPANAPAKTRPGVRTESPRAAVKASDSTPMTPAPALASPPVVRLGSRIAGAVLHINGEAVRILGAPEFSSVPSGTVRISVRAERCMSWDTTVSVRPGDSLSLGYRNPNCR